MLLSDVLDAGNNRHNMDTLSELHLAHKTISYKDLVGTGKKQLKFSDINLKEATEYAAEDADVTLRLYELLSERVNQESLNKIYEIHFVTRPNQLCCNYSQSPRSWPRWAATSFHDLNSACKIFSS